MSLGRTVCEVREETRGLEEDVPVVGFQGWSDEVEKRFGSKFVEKGFHVFFRFGEVPSDVEGLFL